MRTATAAAALLFSLSAVAQENAPIPVVPAPPAQTQPKWIDEAPVRPQAPSDAPVRETYRPSWERDDYAVSRQALLMPEQAELLQRASVKHGWSGALKLGSLLGVVGSGLSVAAMSYAQTDDERDTALATAIVSGAIAAVELIAAVILDASAEADIDRLTSGGEDARMRYRASLNGVEWARY